MQTCGVEKERVRAAVAYGKWSAAAEYRLLASRGIRVGDLTLAALEPYLGRGRLPVLVSVPLSELNNVKVDVVDKVAWSLGVDDAYGHDRFSMTAVVLKHFSSGQQRHQPHLS